MSTVVAPYPIFTFDRHNPRRAKRGIESVQMLVQYDADPKHSEYLWMSKRDIELNIAYFGSTAGLQKALACYR